ncbi:hypothetical protein [Aeromicrobium fastidiosum]|uniref:Uncharacterized protein n=1 Tax=Aeromicrobium fastidiosum TaxID=52699 RepID=A0A641ANU8_9ACTN|nr:hypothetical protein [Aeromicrobium fastidiosum]KAA1378546.1 hypothetical protein ESP62_009375 [Aeromicrobium fastidiosum]MBP2392485.1 hypothetical protein [Aeromicrobium fastidiosum]
MPVGPKGKVAEATAEETAAKVSGDKKKRSKSFPTLPLPDAITIIKSAGEHGMEHSLGAFAKYCGHTSANSGPFKQKLSSFKDWKLVSVNGDRVTITDSSRPLILEKDAASIAAATRSAFTSCDIMERFYQEMAKGVVYSPADLRKHAVVEFEVSSESSGMFAKSIASSAVAAGLATASDDAGSVTFKVPGEVEGAEVEPEVEDSEDDSLQTRGRGAGSGQGAVPPSAPGQAPVVVRQTWLTTHGEVTFEIRSREPLTAGAFGAVAKIVTEAGLLAADLGEPEAGDDLGSA